MHLKLNLFGGTLQYTTDSTWVFEIIDVVSPQDAEPAPSKGNASFYRTALYKAWRFARMYAALSGKSQLIRIYRNEDDYKAKVVYEEYVLGAALVVKVSFFMKRIKF